MKKWVCLFMAIALCLSGCSSTEGTAETGIMFEAVPLNDYTGHALMELQVGLDGNMTAEFDIERNIDIVHVNNMSIVMSNEGDSVKKQYEFWYDGNDGAWVRIQDSTSDSGWGELSMSAIPVYNIEGLLDFLEKEPDACIELEDKIEATWSAEFADVAPILEGMAAGISEVAEAVEFGPVVVTADADKETKELQSVSAEGSGSDGIAEITLKLMLNVTGYGASELAIPDEVRESSQVTANPVKGVFGEPRSDGYVAEPNWLDDGADDQVDSIVEAILRHDVGFNVMDVSHENEMVLMYNTGSRDDWNATMNIYRYDTEEAAKEAFLAQFAEVDSVYGPAKIGGDGTVCWTVYVTDYSDTLGSYVLMLGVQGTMFMHCGGFYWEDVPYEDVIADVMQMVDATEREWGRTE